MSQMLFLIIGSLLSVTLITLIVHLVYNVAVMATIFVEDNFDKQEGILTSIFATITAVWIYATVGIVGCFCQAITSVLFWM